MKFIDSDALMSAVMAQDVVDKSAAKRLILQAPTVDAEPVRHGEWIRDTDHHWDSKFKCSRCEYETDVDTCFGKPLYNYCPYCGARMDGERKEDASD